MPSMGSSQKGTSGPAIRLKPTSSKKIRKSYARLEVDLARLPKIKTKLDNGQPDSQGASLPPTPPLFNCLEAPLRSTLKTGQPLADRISIIQCKTCKRPMLACVAPEHIRLCMQRHKERVQKKKEQKEANRKAREARDRQNRTEEEAAVRGGSLGRDDEVEDEDGNGNGDGDAAAAAAAPGAEGKKSTVGRKRKAEGEAELAAAPPKKKTKKELEAEARLQKARLPKPKGPVDVERQCGVPLPNGGFCARSLTCKSHAMGAKRAVPGRSLPYDTLLAQYQKKNQAKQQKAAIDANAPALEEYVDPSGPIDSDEEKNLIMSALARWRPQPLVQHVAVPMRKRYQYIRTKDMLSQALGGSSAGRGGLFGSAAGIIGGGIVQTPVEEKENVGLPGGNAGGAEGQAEKRRASGAGPAGGGGAGNRPPPLTASRKSSMASMAGLGTPTNPQAQATAAA